MSSSFEGSFDPLDTPTKSREPKQGSLRHSVADVSILDFNDVKTSTPEKSSVAASIVNSHPELNIAIDQNGINPVMGADILFSPSSTKRPSFLDAGDFDRVRRRRDHGVDLYTALAAPPTPPARPRGAFYAFWDRIIRQLFDPTTPYLLSLYLQVMFNALIVSLIAFLIYVFITTIKADIQRKIEVYTSDILEEISTCTREYYRNNCTPGERAPVLEASCNGWQRCINRDPQLLARSKITAETFADIVNGFIKPISWKSLFFINCLVWSSLVVTNVGLGSYRSSRAEVETVRSLQARVRELELELEGRRAESAATGTSTGRIGADDEHRLINKTYMY